MSPLLADLLVADRTRQLQAEAAHHRLAAVAVAGRPKAWTRWSTAARVLSSTVAPRLRLTLPTSANRSGSCCTA